MPKLLLITALAAASLPAPALAVPVGPDAGRCAPGAGGGALLVSISGFKPSGGRVRVQLYGANPADFLAKGRKLHRIDVPLAGAQMDICMPIPQPGRYAVAVRHDANGNKKSDMNDGAGFSRNPRLSILKLEPAYGSVAFAAGDGVQRLPVVMQYRQGISVAPLKKSTG